jgi:hypothetical protein
MIINIKGTDFIIDEKGMEFLANCWKDWENKCFVENGYLVYPSKTNSYSLFFHREFMRWSNVMYLEHKVYKFGHVHHINFNKKDNRLCNLQMLTQEEHHKIHNKIHNNVYSAQYKSI